MASRLWLQTLVCSVFSLAVSASADTVKVLDPRPVMVISGYSEAQPFNNPGGIFIDKKRGDIWVADTGNHRIVSFDSEGVPLIKFLHRAIDPVTGEAYPGRPQSLAVDSLGQVFVADGASDTVAMYDYRGRLIKRINMAKLLGVDRFRALWLDLDTGDNLYVGESEGPRLAVLNRDQQLVGSVSLARSAQPQMQLAAQDAHTMSASMTDISVGADGRIFLVNSGDFPCIRVLDSTGKETVAFGDIDAGWTNFVKPVASVSVEDGTFWVADSGSHIVKQFSKDGSYQQYIGGGPGSRPGEMRYPSALATDGKERLYVAERGTNRIQVFSLEGEKQ